MDADHCLKQSIKIYNKTEFKENEYGTRTYDFIQVDIEASLIDGSKEVTAVMNFQKTFPNNKYKQLINCSLRTTFSGKDAIPPEVSESKIEKFEDY